MIARQMNAFGIHVAEQKHPNGGQMRARAAHPAVTFHDSKADVQAYLLIALMIANVTNTTEQPQPPSNTRTALVHMRAPHATEQAQQQPAPAVHTITHVNAIPASVSSIVRFHNSITIQDVIPTRRGHRVDI